MTKLILNFYFKNKELGRKIRQDNNTVELSSPFKDLKIRNKDLKKFSKNFIYNFQFYGLY